MLVLTASPNMVHLQHFYISGFWLCLDGKCKRSYSSEDTDLQSAHTYH